MCFELMCDFADYPITTSLSRIKINACREINKELNSLAVKLCNRDQAYRF